jgi:hypothetical protein
MAVTGRHTYTHKHRHILLLYTPPPPHKYTHTHTHKYIIYIAFHCILLAQESKYWVRDWCLDNEDYCLLEMKIISWTMNGLEKITEFRGITNTIPKIRKQNVREWGNPMKARIKCERKENYKTRKTICYRVTRLQKRGGGRREIGGNARENPVWWWLP